MIMSHKNVFLNQVKKKFGRENQPPRDLMNLKELWKAIEPTQTTQYFPNPAVPATVFIKQ